MEDFSPSGVLAPQVPGYDVGRCLGRGSSATVWLVTEAATGREYALKYFNDPSGADGNAAGHDDAPARGEAEAAMRREIRILSALDHGHLVRAHAVVRPRAPGGGNGGTAGLGLVLDFAPGGSLAGLLASRGQLGAGETVTVLTPVAQALAYLHGHGFTHGDVSPGNVLFSAHGKPLLADLGVARMVADAVPVATAGTEGFRDPAPVDAVRAGLQPERDVYSLAALGWYCLTGRVPEAGAQRPPLPLLVAGVPAALAEALEAGLNDDRRQRPSAGEFAAAVYRSAEPTPVDLSVSVHPTVIPRLLTRHALPRTARQRRAERLRAIIGRNRIRRRHPILHGRDAAARAVHDHPAAGRHSAIRPAQTDGSTSDGSTSAGSTIARPGGRADRHTTGRSNLRRGGTSRAVLAVLALALLAWAWLASGGGVPGSPDLAAGGSRPAPMPGPAREPAPSSAGQPDKASGQVADAVPEPVTVPVDLQALLASADPAEAVRGLARLRSLALSSGDLRLLEQVNVPASPAAAADARIRDRLTESGHVLAGFQAVITRLDSAAGGASRSVVAVSVSTTPYEEQDAGGAVVATAEAGAEQRLQLVLAPVEGRWRIQEILPGTEPAGH